jgi:hypothetical protein
MSNYTKTTDFAAKDSLPSGDSGKIIKGTEFETEFDNIVTAVATKSNSAGPTFTGTVTYATLNDGTTALTSTVAELNILDGVTSTAAELNILDGVTSTAAELNILDGVTSTAAELNILDGVTSTASELNILDGVTSTTAELNILDGVTATAAELNLIDGVTATTAELNTLDGVTSTFTELNLLDGVTSTTAELNILDGVTSTTAELNILDGVTSTAAELNILDGKAFLDENNFASDSATGIASQQSIKAYVDGSVSSVTPSSTTTLTNKTLTSPKINEDVAVTSTATELNLLDGVTSTTAELNILDGVTSTAAELNILDGVTSTAAELNILDGVTSTFTELNLLDGVTSTTAELNILDGVTSTAAELNILDGVTSTATELNILDGVTATTAELNYLDIATLGLTAASKAVTADANGVITLDNGFSEEYAAVASSSAAVSLDLRTASNFSHDLTENTTISFANPAASGKVSAATLRIIQGSTARTITWNSSIKWAADTAPTLTTTDDAVDIFVFYTVDGGTTYYGFTAGQVMS